MSLNFGVSNYSKYLLVFVDLCFTKWDELLDKLLGNGSIKIDELGQDFLQSDAALRDNEWHVGCSAGVVRVLGQCEFRVEFQVVHLGKRGNISRFVLSVQSKV